ncbi:uncharacterized protein LOC127137682, partial [Lathyrus oleraceus]|uniref:uncharacterized protein LOC127137682 n=1 Tax=Pisum sativum TaxID=3888 RepID=UPI0021D1EE16
KEKLSGTNFLDWHRNLRIVLKHDKKLYVLETPVPEEEPPKFQKQHENMAAFDMIEHLKMLYQEQARHERFEVSKAFFQSKLAKGAPVSPHVLKMIGYVENLERLGFPLGKELATDLILQSLPNRFKQFVLNFNMNDMDKPLPELLGMLRTAEQNLKKKGKSILYLSLEFDDHLKECGILSQLTPPGTPQWNGVSERRNRTLLDMVRSMMSHADLPNSFWGHALLTAAYTLNRVPSKKVEKTPYEIWSGKKPHMSYIKIWGCEVYVKRQISTKLEPKSDKCLFVGYPKETRGYYFYNPSEGKVFVARTGVFLEKDFISKGTSGRKVEL